MPSRPVGGYADDAAAAFRQTYSEAIPMKRYGTPAEMAALASFLSSEAAGYLTGVSIPVDGGFMASQPVRRSEKLSVLLAERPANGGLLRIGGQSPGCDFGILGAKSPIVSGKHLKNSRFWQVADGDLVRSALPGRSGSACCRGAICA
jgi:hypothetical protein